MIKRAWDKEQIDRLKQLVTAGVSLARAAVMLKRTQVSAQTQARKVGTPFPTARNVKKLRDAKIAAAEQNSPARTLPGQMI